ncbi:TRAP transporter small permease [uncultured Roseobacter sp.]|uniref:TRAP transporter small permease n=1 Tax=uncultured Roseobacter sp. TaxID=114847 RepID=UPI002602FEE1|nr:TRAP transporter small permease [uncultured Roseobacter sp.]
MHQAVQLLARGTAIIGGLVLVGLVALTTVSTAGRELGLGEVNGSYEILEAGVAFAIFSFFPICQLYGAHATVDIFTSRLPDRVNRAIIAFWELVLTAAVLLISWRLYEGMQRYIGNGETTLFLQFPVWWGYAFSFAACVVTCIVAIYCAVLRVREVVSGRTLLPTA